jgi:hypothetical protein
VRCERALTRDASRPIFSSSCAPNPGSPHNRWLLAACSSCALVAIPSRSERTLARAGRISLGAERDHIAPPPARHEQGSALIVRRGTMPPKIPLV